MVKRGWIGCQWKGGLRCANSFLSFNPGTRLSGGKCAGYRIWRSCWIGWHNFISGIYVVSPSVSWTLGSKTKSVYSKCCTGNAWASACITLRGVELTDRNIVISQNFCLERGCTGKLYDCCNHWVRKRSRTRIPSQSQVLPSQRVCRARNIAYYIYKSWKERTLILSLNLRYGHYRKMNSWRWR